MDSFKEEEVLKKINSRKLLALIKYLSKKCDNILQLCSADYKQNTIEKWTKGYIFHFLQERQPWNH